jgi:hypothetical protein
MRPAIRGVHPSWLPRLSHPLSFESLYTADAGPFVGVFALALLTGVIAGLLPARRATRVDPVEILRQA